MKQMKQTVGWILVSVVACAICSLVTYHIAYHRSYRNATVDEIGRCRFHQSVALLAALQTLRAGDIPRAIRQMEQSCFASAHIFYKDPTPTYPDAATTKAIAQELMKYRAAYRTNSADWDDMERKLVVELAKLK